MTDQETIAALREQVDAMTRIMENYPETHARFGILHPDGTREEPDQCADWCYACKLEKLEHLHNQAALVATNLAAGSGSDHTAQICGLIMERKYDDVHALLKRELERKRKYRQQRHHTVVSVIHVEDSHGKLDCCDEEEFHVWVTVPAWSGRRAYITGASPFMEAAGSAVPDVYSLKGEHFYADLPFEPPPAQPEPGEYLEWPNLELCPPIDEIKKRLGVH